MDDPRFCRRLLLWQGGLSVLGLAAWTATKGFDFALSFLLGAIMASASFWLLHRLVFTAGTGQPVGISGVLAVFRLLLIGGAISVIITTYELHRNAAGSGILVVIVSILLEVVREHLHGT